MGSLQYFTCGTINFFATWYIYDFIWEVEEIYFNSLFTYVDYLD